VRWKAVLTSHVLLHVLKQSEDNLLVVGKIALVLSLFFLVLDREFIDLFLFLVKNFVLLGVFVLS
jgi:hypothetical protein